MMDLSTRGSAFTPLSRSQERHGPPTRAAVPVLGISSQSAALNSLDQPPRGIWVAQEYNPGQFRPRNMAAAAAQMPQDQIGLACMLRGNWSGFGWYSPIDDH
jgi:hypothetical protein